MAVTVYDNKALKAQKGSKVIPGVRLYLNSDRTKIVPEGHPEARYLYCNEHKAVPKAELEKLLVKETPQRGAEEASGAHIADSEGSTPSPATKRTRKRKTKSKAAAQRAEE